MMNLGKEKGITLVALVVTIIILLILAGVTLSQISGNNGLFSRTKQAVEKYKEGEKKEQNSIYELEESIKNLQEKSPIMDIYVTLYTDGTLSFSNNSEYIKDKEVKKEYGNIKGQQYFLQGPSDGLYYTTAPWNDEMKEIKKIRFENEIIPTSTSAWFVGCNITGMEDIENIENLNTHSTTSMNDMFLECTKLKNLDLKTFDTSKVEYLHRMFFRCLELEELNISSFNTENVKNMFALFYECESIKNINLRNFNIKSIDTPGSIAAMFLGCRNLETVDLSSFDTSNITSLRYMFHYCESLTELDISNFDTRNVNDMEAMFNHCSKLNKIYVGENWVINPDTNVAYMFDGCSVKPTLKTMNN